MSIIVSRHGKNAVKINKSAFDSEKYLQEYIHNNPESIPLYEISEDIKVLILAREVSTKSGSIDALGIDLNGDIYIIETKLFKNPDKRTVIAQVIDYGASIWSHSDEFPNFFSHLDAKVQKAFNQTLSQKVSSYFELDELGVQNILDSMRNNIVNGVFKFVILMDTLETRLKDLIKFINQNSKFDTYAVELEYYKFEDYELMIPRIFGGEVKKSVTSMTARPKGTWSEESFFTALKAKVSPEGCKRMRMLFESAPELLTSVEYGNGVSLGSFKCRISSTNKKNCTLFTAYTDGSIEVATGLRKSNGNEAFENAKSEFISTVANSFPHIKEGVEQNQNPFIKVQDITDSDMRMLLEAYKKLAETLVRSEIYYS